MQLKCAGCHHQVSLCSSKHVLVQHQTCICWTMQHLSPQMWSIFCTVENVELQFVFALQQFKILVSVCPCVNVLNNNFEKVSTLFLSFASVAANMLIKSDLVDIWWSIKKPLRWTYWPFSYKNAGSFSSLTSLLELIVLLLQLLVLLLQLLQGTADCSFNLAIWNH